MKVLIYIRKVLFLFLCGADRRGAGGAGPGRFVRFHPHDVQRRRTRRFFVRQDRQGAAT